MSGNSNHGILVGTPTLTTNRFGSNACAYAFPGTSTDYIKISYTTNFEMASAHDSMSISLWYQGGSSSAGDLEQLFVQQAPFNPNGFTYFNYGITLYDCNKPTVFTTNSQNIYTFNTSNGSCNTGDTAWHHLVFNYNDSVITQYIDDSIVNSTCCGGSPSINYCILDFAVGKDFQGKIDDVRFYKRTLNPLEVHQLYTLANSCVATNITAITNTTLSLVPNPTSNTFTLTGVNIADIAKVYVTDLMGKVVLNTTSTTVNIDNLNAGTYLVKVIKINGKHFVFKLAKE